jgi:methionyl-tRNA formyltransferase
LKVFFLGNGWLGWKALDWLVARRVEIVGLAVHPPDRMRYGHELLNAASLPEPRVFDASRLQEEPVLNEVERLRADLALSVLCGYVLRPTFLKLFSGGAVNLHTALLPHNRGAHTNVWPLVDGTPAGVTLHRIDPGVDTGPILAQMEVHVEPVDTAATLYQKLERAGLKLLQENWDPLVRGDLEPRPQDLAAGSFHRVADLRTLDRIDLDEPTTARAVIDQLRARTFPPHASAYFVEGGRKVYVRIALSYEREAGP